MKARPRIVAIPPAVLDQCPVGARMVPLKCGKYALVDADIYGEIACHRWYAGSGSVRRADPARKGGLIHMHRVIIGAKRGQIVDHIDGDFLNNRRCNLRFATARENARNQRTRVDNACGFRGLRRERGGYRVRITSAGRTWTVGTYPTFEEAKEARIAAEQREFGEFAACRGGRP